jgi:hypothetical protein
MCLYTLHFHRYADADAASRVEQVFSMLYRHTACTEQPQSLQPQSLQPQSLQPQSLQPQSLQPQSLQPHPSPLNS